MSLRLFPPAGAINALAGGNVIGLPVVVSTGTLYLMGGNNITLSQQGQSISILAAGGSVGAGIQTIGISNLGNTLGTSGVATGSAVQVVFAGGNNITLSQSLNGASATITLIGANIPAQTQQPMWFSAASASGGAFSGATATSSASTLSLYAGQGITLSQNSANAITIQGVSIPPMVLAVGVSGGNTSNASGSSTGSVYLQGGNNVTLSGTGSTIVISGPTIPVATNFSLNGSSSSVSLVAGANITFNSGASSITIVGVAAQTVQPVWLSAGSIAGGTSSGATATTSASTLSLVAGSGITLSQNSSNAITIIGNTTAAQSVQPVWFSAGTVAGGVSLGATASTSASTLSLIAGPGITLSQNSLNAITISGPDISFTQNALLQELAPVLIGSVTTTGNTAAVQPFNSSLLLQRFFVPAAMNLTEVDIAIGINFPATNQGQGSMSQSVVIYSFGNATSLASVFSTSGTSSWTTGSATNAGSSYSQSQIAWQGNNIKPLTFGSTTLPPGDYVVGHLLAFAGASTSWTVSLFGPNVVGTTASLAAMTNITSASTTMVSGTASTVTGAFTNVSFTTAVMTAFSAAPTAASVMGSAGLSAFGASKSMLVGTAAADLITMGATASGVSIAGFSKADTISFTSLAGSWFTNSGSSNVISNAGTIVMTRVSSMTTGSVNVIQSLALSTTTGLSAVGAAALASITYAATTNQSFGFIGTQSGSTTTNVPNNFVVGIMSTGGIPTSIALTNTALTLTGTVAQVQPYFALAGA